MKYFDLLNLPHEDQNQLAVKCDALEENGYLATATLFRQITLEGPIECVDWKLISPYMDEYILANMDFYEGPTICYGLFIASIESIPNGIKE